MKYGIVKEVMMIEERKAIRMLAAAKPVEKTPPKEDNKPTSVFDKKGLKSPRGTSKNKDLANLNAKKNQYGIYRPPQKIFLDALPDDGSKRKQRAQQKENLHDSQITEFSKSPKKDSTTPFGSAMKDVTKGANSTISFQPDKKKAINFGDSSIDNNTASYTRSKDAPTIGNPLMMKMEFQSRREKKGRSGVRSQSGVESLSRFSRG